jgi:hypothetical protein
MAQKTNPEKFWLFTRSPLLAEAFNMFLLSVAGLVAYWPALNALYPLNGDLAFAVGWFVFVLAVVFCVLLLNERKPIVRAWVYHLLVGWGYALAVWLLLASAFLWLSNSVILWAVLCVSFLVRLIYVMLGLRASRSENIKTKRLSQSGTAWNVHKKLILRLFEPNPRYLRIWEYAQIFVFMAGVLSVYALNSTEVARKIIAGGGLYVLICLTVMFTVSTHIGLAIQLFIWGWQQKADILLAKN